MLKSQQVINAAIVVMSFVMFFDITFYHVWECLLKSRLQKLIMEVKRIFMKSAPLSNFDDAEVPLMCSGSPAVVYKTGSVSLVSVVMRWESLLFDEND